jgi:hypothetical protein
MTKRAVIVGLVGLNLLLLGGLILMVYDLPQAYAQGVGRSANYAMVAGKIDEGIDAVYLLDLDRQILDVILVNKQGNVPQIAGRRPGPDVISDLRRGPVEPPPRRGRR